MGAVAWAIRQRSVSHPRSSNRTCPIKASGSPTGLTVRHTAGPLGAGVRDAADRVLHRQRHRRTVGCHALPLCAVWRGSRARAHRRINPTCHQTCGSLDDSSGLSIPSILLVPFRPRASHIMDAGRYCLIDPPHKEIRRFEAAVRNLARIASKEVSKNEYTLMRVSCLLSRSHRQGVS